MPSYCRTGGASSPKSSPLPIKEPPPQQLFYLDIQADEGGGSWAKAKIQTMEQLSIAATQPPAELQRIVNMIYDAKLQKTEFGQMICEDIIDGGITDVSQLCQGEIDWLVDVDKGLGYAPNFGGLRLQTKCHFFQLTSEIASEAQDRPVTETDTIYVAFSGAKAWQDLNFAVCAMRHITNHFTGINDECFEFDFDPLKEIPEVRFWMQSCGVK